MSKANEPAFPQNVDNRYAMNGDCLGIGPVKGGLTKREYFAALAMQGICANSIPGDHHRPENAASEAVCYADALIAELEKGEK